MKYNILTVDMRMYILYHNNNTVTQPIFNCYLFLYIFNIMNTLRRPAMKKPSKLKEFVKKHKKLCIVIGLVLVIIIAITFFVSNTKKKMNALMNAMNVQETAQIERRTIVESISATGQVTSAEAKSISVSLNNVKIESVNVEVGDVVNVGDVICVMNSEDIEENLANAKITLSATNSRTGLDISSAKRQLSEALESKDINLQRANADVSDAYNDYESAVNTMDDAEDALDDAEDVTAAKKAAYEKALNAYNAAVKSGSVSSGDASVSGLKAALEKAQSEYEAAQQAESTAKTAYEAAKDKANSLYDVYEKQVETRDDKERSDNSSVSSRQESLKSSQISASTSGLTEKQQVESYEEQLEDCMVKSPISGVVTKLNVEAGDMYNGSAIAVIENIDSYEVTAEIDEYDISKIEVGQRAVIKTNGTGDEELEGTVKSIAPRATGGSSVTYTVTISVDTPNDDLRMDMTAKISIIIESKENVLSVPYESLQQDADGRYYIEVTDNASSQEEKPRKGENPAAGISNTGKIYVEKGVESDYYIEIITDDDLEGMEVVVPSSDSGMDAQGMLMIQGPMGGF
jgi:multidrug efflux pump subunit AcrA (membrane-fusion protein)